MEPNIYQLEKWMEEEEHRLRQACRDSRGHGADRQRQTKKPAMLPALGLIWAKRSKGGG